MNNKINSKPYLKKINSAFTKKVENDIQKLAIELKNSWKKNKNIFICGNGGSSANAMHIANDFIYGAGIHKNGGLKIEALTSNSSVITCLANDIGYENIFSEQLKVKANKGDLLIILSGSGNSLNVINALNFAKDNKIKSFSILGYDGGECKKISDHSIHFNINDMQVSEDLQLITGHLCMQWLLNNS